MDKLRIEKLKKDKGNSTLEALEVQVNPERYSLSHEIQFNKKQEIGSSKKSLKFNKMLPEVLSLEFIFDKSGIIPKSENANFDLKELTDGLHKDILQFKKFVLNYDGKQHRSPAIKIIWGDLIFIGRLTQLSFEYKLFKPSGKPIRAVAKATFKGSTESQFIKACENNSSPDLTHIRIVKHGDQLPLLVNDIYDSPMHFLEVAKANKLVNFRKLALGQQVRFPPFQKQ